MATALNDIYDLKFGKGSGSNSSEYRPSANEEFMNEAQLAYFKQKLLDWKDSIIKESLATMASNMSREGGK